MAVVKLLLSFLIRALRTLFYNTPIRHWRVTEIIYTGVGRLLLGSDPNPIVQLAGMRLKTNGRDVIVTAALMNGNYEPFTLRIFRQLISEALVKNPGKPCVVVDVGANIGVFTVTAARIDPRVQVFAFEPNPASYALLEENLLLNDLKNVTVTPSAVGEKAGSASLDISSPQAGMHSIYGPGAERIEVPVVALDDFIAERQVVPAILKVDVEGYEPQVLLGMKSLLSRGEFRMILEFNSEHLKRGGKDPVVFLDELVAQFDFVYCLDEIARQAVPYVRGDEAIREKILSVGFNFLLVRGRQFFQQENRKE
jgi:FkbM family methyltransferase